MTMWIIIMWAALSLTAAALVYVSNRVCGFGIIKRLTKDSEKRKAAIGGSLVFGGFAVVGLIINFMNAIICIIYIALAWMFCDFATYIVRKVVGREFKRYYAGGAALLIAISALVFGWYCDHRVWATNYVLDTDKNVKPLRIVMFADSHVGTTFNAAGFAEHVAAMQAQNPDIVIVAGDFVDDGTDRKSMVESVAALGKLRTTYGVYLVFGNHDGGYYGAQYRGFGATDLVAELENNGVKVLFDEVVPVGDDFYVIGRRDHSVEREQGGRRRSMSELTAGLDKSKYMIVADHQPADYKNQAASGVDLVLSGHTHGGQLWPFNQMGKFIGANDRIYGREKRGQTDFIVTSGLSDWAIKFKTGTKSEYTVIDIQKRQ